jgi:hypothetical protein
MIKNLMASRLLLQNVERLKSVLEELDMAVYGKGTQGFGFVYNNLGDLLKKVHSVGATRHHSLFHSSIEQKTKSIARDSMEQLKENMSRLQDMSSRLQFMLGELEGLVKKA